MTGSGNLAAGGSVSKGYTGGGIGKELASGYLNAANFSRAPYLLLPVRRVHGPDRQYLCDAIGNLGRNTYRGPYQQNGDFSLQKNFSLTERFAFRFGTDFFNIWNHANFASPAVTDVETISTCTPNVNGCPANGLSLSSPFGKIFSTVGTPRLIQSSLRLAFQLNRWNEGQRGAATSSKVISFSGYG